VLCPLGGVGVGGKWKFWIWYHLLSSTKRFGELQRLVPDASRQMLTFQLRELEAIGVVHRHVYEQLPPKVEYSLSDVAMRAGPMLRQFYAWGRRCAEEMGIDYDHWLMVMSGRWLFWIWYHLLTGAKRFGELERLLPKANHQILTTQLRDLQQLGVVQRQAVVEGAPKVVYSLTEMGREAEPMMRETYAWGKWFCDQLHLEFEWPLNGDTEEPLRLLDDAMAAAGAWETPLAPDATTA
jgi:DNA-binding HxlR family transcriptional regulator